MTAAYANLGYDWGYAIKNAPFDAYVKYKKDEQTGMNVTSKQNVTIDNQTAVKIQGDGINLFSGIKFIEYMLMHDKKSYCLVYMANVKDLNIYQSLNRS